MTQEKLIDAITDLDSDILNRYFDMKADLAAKKKPRKRTWVKWISIAACFMLIVGGIFGAPSIIEIFNGTQPDDMGDIWLPANLDEIIWASNEQSNEGPDDANAFVTWNGWVMDRTDR